MSENPRKAYEPPRVTTQYAWAELLTKLGPAHAIYELPENP
jgi:hypothetical protein